MGHPLPSHGDMVDAIVVMYDHATPSQVYDGERWYAVAGRIVEAIAAETTTDTMRVAYALAALSPRNPWAWNVADAYAFAAAAAEGADMPTATTYGANQRAAWAALTSDEIPWTGTALKVRAFVSAVMGDEHSVVVDVWAMRVVTNGERSEPRSVGVYRRVAYAYTEAARVLGVTPCTVQAVTWLVAQSAGLGSKRRNRHDRTCKRGTHPFVLDLLA
jgi:hypothetical protein